MILLDPIILKFPTSVFWTFIHENLITSDNLFLFKFNKNDRHVSRSSRLRERRTARRTEAGNHKWVSNILICIKRSRMMSVCLSVRPSVPSYILVTIHRIGFDNPSQHNYINTYYIFFGNYFFGQRSDYLGYIIYIYIFQ